MKATVKPIEQPKGFEPFEVTITVESEADLCNLWNRLNLINKAVRDAYRVTPDLPVPDESSSSTHQAWKVIDEEAKERGLR